MNTILFEQHEVDGESLARLSGGDKRVEHVRSVLRAGVGDRLSAGVVDGALGTAEIVSDTPDGMLFRLLSPERDRAFLERERAVSIAVLLGSVRPIVLKRLLRDLTSFGVDEIIVARTELSERSYFRAKLWEGTGVRSALIEGAAQGNHTRLPRIDRCESLRDAFRSSDRRRSDGETRIVLNCGSPPLPEVVATRSSPRVVLAVGPERGFVEREIAMLLEHGFTAAGVPGGTLRTESAAIAAVAVARSVIRAID